MNLKHLVMGATIAAGSIFGLQDAVAQEVKQDCHKCEERVEKHHVQRGSHALQPFKAYVVADDDTSEAYQFKIPRQGDDMRRVHDNTDWQMMLPLDQEGQLVTPDGDVYLVPTQKGDRIRNTPKVDFRGQDAYLIGKRDGFRALMADNGCESSPAGIIFGETPDEQEVEQIINNYTIIHKTQADDKKPPQAPPKDLVRDDTPSAQYNPAGTRVFAGAGLVTGRDDYRQHTTRTVSTPANRNGTRFELGLDHWSKDVRARASFLKQAQEQVFENAEYDIEDQNLSLQALYNLGSMGIGAKVDLDNKSVTGANQTQRTELRYGPQIAVMRDAGHFGLRAQQVSQEDSFQGAVNLEDRFEGYRFGGFGEARIDLGKGWGAEVAGSLSYQELEGDTDKSAIKKSQTDLNVQANIVKALSDSFELYLKGAFSNAHGNIQAENWDQDFDEKTGYAGVGGRIRF